MKTDSLVPAETEESMRTLDSARLSRQATSSRVGARLRVEAVSR